MLVVGILNVFNGVWLLLVVLPRYQRRLAAGEIKRDSRLPSLPALRRIPFGLLIIGLLFLVGWALQL